MIRTTWPGSIDQDLTVYSLHSDSQATGRFWLPANPSAKWWGQLRRFSGGRALIQLHDESGASKLEGGSVRTIHGELTTGLICTLLDGTVVYGHPHSGSGSAFALIEDPVIAYGAHIENKGARCLRHLRVKFTHVNEWFGRPYSLESLKGLRTFTIDYAPVELSFSLTAHGNPVTISLFCERVVPSTIEPTGGAWPYWYRFDLVPEKAESLEWFLTVASQLRQCLMILIGQPIYTLELEPGFGNEPGGVYEELVILPVHSAQRVQVDPYRFASSYSDLSEVFASVVQAWFREYERHALIAHTYEEVLLGRVGNVESLFLRIVQSLEQLHGVALPDKGWCVPRGDWKRIASELTAHLERVEVCTIPDWDGTRDLLTRRLMTLNSVDLRTRLRHLLELVPLNLLMPILFNPRHPGEEMQQFPKRVADARNDLSHGKHPSVAGPIEFGRLVQSCWGLHSYVAAHLVGIPPEVAGAMAMKASGLTRRVDRRSQL